jgi:hypothetical protein
VRKRKSTDNHLSTIQFFYKILLGLAYVTRMEGTRCRRPLIMSHTTITTVAYGTTLAHYFAHFVIACFDEKEAQYFCFAPGP